MVDGELRVGEVNIFTGTNYVLSVRNHSQQGFLGVRARCEREPELLKVGSGYVLYALMDAVVDRYFPVLEALEVELETLEERLFSGGFASGNVEALYALKQKLSVVKHASGPLLETVGKLYGGRVPAVCHGLGEYFRDVYDHVLRINQTIDALRDTVITAISVNAALATMQQGETTRRLAAGAALVAVPTLIAGVYGMNFKHMPELGWELGYPLAIGMMVAIDGYLIYRFRKAGWL
jgi:magnesium transporter